jgi:phosphoribosylaminoimidazolecarboxamide formyltransferase/IMP cyclohydrolase/phosphoribosylaminoimidazolecarboxamide formyltransferase
MDNSTKTSIKLRYGLNPGQTFGELKTGEPSPISVLSGAPSYINLLDALRGWKLVRELRRCLDLPSAASYKHVNPAGVGLGTGFLDDNYKRAHFLPNWALSPLAIAYIRARQADRISSYGDFIALSDPVDAATALVIKGVASDGVIAPGYDLEALSILREKRAGRFLVLSIDSGYEPKGVEARDEFGLTLVQDRDFSDVPDVSVAQIVTSNSSLHNDAAEGLLLAMIVAKHTQSNAVAVVADGHTIGIGAGQQSRIAATRIACDKAEAYLLYDHPKILDLKFQPSLSRVEKMNTVELLLRFDTLGAEERMAITARLRTTFEPLSREEKASWLKGKGLRCLASDAAIPFRDNIDRAASAGVTHIVQTGGSKRDSEVTSAANQHGIVMLHTGARHFLH